MPNAFRFSVAPMLDYTDRHFRVLMRQVSRHSLLYTEMVVARALDHLMRQGPPHCNAERQRRLERLIGFDSLERPLALQLGGDTPQELARAARLAAAWGFDEVKLNVGCPSPKASQGNFGACLMAHPERGAEGVAAMAAASGLPITVKHRIGIDQRDGFSELLQFVATVAAAGAAGGAGHGGRGWREGL
ncbi:MAG: tRNA-dihydrouridine synthase, partial [Cyanobium sp.]